MSSHTSHAAAAAIHAPNSRFYHGPFGRMFRNLPAWEPEGATESAKLKSLAELAKQLLIDDGSNESLDNPNIPAGYTYLGQFIDHDITFDPTSSLQRANDPEKLRNFRTPRLDLDCVYGRGRDDQPYLYSQEAHKSGPMKGKPKGLFLIEMINSIERDLPRNQDRSAGGDPPSPFTRRRVALIGDPRNDENIIVSQFQLAMLLLHNTRIEAGDDFDTASRFVRWHYQWVVLNDFLRRICGSEVIDELLGGSCPGRPNLCFYGYREAPYMPVEFAGAAYRLGHSMVRPTYHLNDRLEQLRGGASLFILGADPQDDLRGGRQLPDIWSVQWNRFVDFEGSTPQLSRRLDRHVAEPLSRLPIPDMDPIFRNLGFRNLLRGWRLGLPSGQDVARRMAIPAKEILDGNDPLWVYVLREAELQKGGLSLGPVGGRIVAEVFVGLLAADPNSFLSVHPTWRPEKASFQLADLLSMSGSFMKEIPSATV